MSPAWRSNRWTSAETLSQPLHRPRVTIQPHVGIRLWDWRHDRLINRIDGNAEGVAFDPTGEMLITNRLIEGVADVWDAHTGSACPASRATQAPPTTWRSTPTARGSPPPVRTAAFGSGIRAPDGSKWRCGLRCRWAPPA